MKSSALLALLSRIESSLSEFSYEELTTQEAVQLKQSFQVFQNSLTDMVFGQKVSSEIASEDEFVSSAYSEVSENKKLEIQPEVMLIANVSHEIRTPLNGIVGFADLLKEGELNTKQLGQVNAIQSASYSLLEIVNELLEYSKLAAGLEEFQFSEFNLFGLIRDVMYLCNTLVINKNVELTSTIESGVSETLVGDPSKLTQVLLNVMGNAIKFVDKGEVNLSIQRLEEKEESTDHILLEFEISDNGIGISKEKIHQIFDSFKQAEADTYSKYGGTGLGLSIVQKIIDNLGGSINITSDLGVGTTFKFCIPFEKGKNTVKSKSIERTHNAQNNIKLVEGMNVLVFEDNLLNQRFIEQRLKSWKCQIHITDQAEHGIDILENNTIDIVLMDLRMPGKSGFEVTELIRKNKALQIREVYIVALTADYTIRDKEKCNSCGINDYLLKPFSPEELLQKLVSSQNHFENNDVLKPSLNNSDKPINTESVVDLKQFFEDCLNDIDMLKELIVLFKQNAIEFFEKGQICMQNKDFEGLASAAHKIKAGLAMVKAEDLLTIIEEIRIACVEDPDWKHLESLYTSFSNEYPKVEEGIDKAAKELK